MTNYNQLTPTKKARVITLRQEDHSFDEIAERIGCSKSTAYRTWDKYHEKENYYHKTPGRGRPKALDTHDRRIACRLIRSGQSDTAADVQRDHFPEVSVRTMQETLAQEGLHGRHKRKVSLLTRAHCRKRMEFARNHVHWTAEDWRAVIFSDESKFMIFGSDGLQYCRRGPGEAFDPRNVQQRLKHGGGKIMVWGCMTAHGFGRLIRVEGNMDAAQYCRILEEGLLGTLDDHDIDRRSAYFQQDNDPKHTSGRAKKWLSNNHFELLGWPANSPDLNIIENAWHALKHAYNKRSPKARNADELFQILQEEWGKLSVEFCSKLYDSLPTRMDRIIKAKGKWIGY